VNKPSTLTDNPLWYKDAIIYETHIRSFYDSDDNGMGDLRGLTSKLEYLKNLGITAIWLLPFYPSPLKDDGYDIADYFAVHPDYGTIGDFRAFLRRAHDIGIRVITELVLNHTSDQHPWFKRARAAKPGSPWRNFYVWSNTPDKYPEARIIFQDFENSNWAWDPVAKAYYWHRFYSHQPDLNYDNPLVRKAILRALDFWLGMGVDGMRLDAVPYLYERDGTNCENLPETHAFLKELRSYVDARYPNRMFLGEANQWPEDAVAYFGDGDECHMAFHFPIMPRLFMALWMEDRFPIVDILEQTPSIPESCQWALFLRNHDELTLEMVSDEERDYMYRVYARDSKARINLGIRRRLAPLMGNNRRKTELMNVLLFSLPGTPIIYYGDELGMGDNYFLGDRNGVRTPMQWSPDRNAGFSKANPQKLYLPVIIDPEYHYEVINVETQERNLSSMLWWMRRVISVRKRFKAFGRGEMQFLYPQNPKVLAFIRRFEDEIILVVINLSRFSQVAELNLSQYEGYVPEEVFSGNRFPRIEAQKPYTLTLSFHDYFWFILRKERERVSIPQGEALPVFEIKEGPPEPFPHLPWDELTKGPIADYLKRCPYFGGKGKEIRGLSIVDRVPSAHARPHLSNMLFLQATYPQGETAQIFLHVGIARGEEATSVRLAHPESVIARLSIEGDEGILYDGIYSPAHCEAILDLISRRRKVRGDVGYVVGHAGKGMRELLEGKDISPSGVLAPCRWMSSVAYGPSLILKFYHKFEGGISVSEEVLRYLTEEIGFHYLLPYAGSLRYAVGDRVSTIGLLQGNVPNQGDGWQYAVGAAELFFERALSSRNGSEAVKVQELAREWIDGLFLEMVELLGRRTAQLHAALSSSRRNQAFAPEPFSKLYQRSVYQSMRNEVGRCMGVLSAKANLLPEDKRPNVLKVPNLKREILEQMRKVVVSKMEAQKIRVHGDYHLGQLLFTGKDFAIANFEGDMARPLSERRLKRSALRDVAAMIYSLYRAAAVSLSKMSAIRPEEADVLKPWLEPWRDVVAGAFLRSYVDEAKGQPFLPKDESSLNVWLEAFLLERAICELELELSEEDGKIEIPIGEIERILKHS